MSAFSGTLIPTSPYGEFSYTGEISNGDAEKMVRAFSTLAKRLPQMRLILDSPGGSVEEAFKVASVVKALHLAVRVRPGGICASACFFVFLAADLREADGGDIAYDPAYIQKGRVGLHRPFLNAAALDHLSATDARNQQKNAAKRVVAYLQDEALPQRLIDSMMTRPSNDIYWMTHADLQQIGAYPPALEELLIARCGYTRHLWQDFGQASRSSDPDIVESGKEHEKTYRACLWTALKGQQTEIGESLHRMRTGWRPWDSPH